MAATVGAKIVWADITYVVDKINNARTKHGLSAFSLTATTKPEAATITTLIAKLTEANNKITNTTITINIAGVSPGTILQASKLTEIYNVATNVQNHCTCNSQCSCNCNYCYCYCSCDGYCSCDCDYCPCNCNRCPQCPDCTCNCYNCPQCPDSTWTPTT